MNLRVKMELNCGTRGLALAALVLALMLHGQHAVTSPSDASGGAASSRVHLAEPEPEPGPASLIDWKTYTAAFNKNYSSWRQALVRQNLFTVKKLQVFLTAAKYRLNLLSYYMVINQYSDLTPEEERRKMSSDYGEDEDSDGLMDDEAVRKLLMAELDEAAYDKRRPDAARLAAANKRQQQKQKQQQQQQKQKQKQKQKHPHKRSTDEQTEPPLPQLTGEHLSLHDLVRMPDTTSQRDDFGNALKIKWVVPSNNPDYQPMELMSMGVGFDTPADDTEKLDDVPEEEIEKIQKSASSWLATVSNHLPNLGVVNFLSGSAKSTFSWLRSKSFNWRQSSGEQDQDQEQYREQGQVRQPERHRMTRPQGGESVGDGEAKQVVVAPPPIKKSEVVIKDWRDTGCIAPPIQQGQCMSCYAVTAVSHLEWSFCMHQERVLTPLSIQYLLSCGPQMRQENEPKMNLQLHGCDHGRSWQAMYFIKEYGAELAAHMPYLARDTPCPVEPRTPRRSKGYLRPNVKQQVRMYANTKQLDLALKVGPVIVNFHQPYDFFAYGGGMVGRCHPHGSHAMLIVGHGIENDKPYLIIKNSFGTNWGMRGYFKFDRKYTTECVKDFIVPRFSFPSKKSQARHMKAYLAERQESAKETEDYGPSSSSSSSSSSQENSVPNLDKIFDTDAGGLL